MTRGGCWPRRGWSPAPRGSMVRFPPIGTMRAGVRRGDHCVVLTDSHGARARERTSRRDASMQMNADRARVVAESLHHGQRDRGGAPLIEHIRRVAAQCPPPRPSRRMASRVARTHLDLGGGAARRRPLDRRAARTQAGDPPPRFPGRHDLSGPHRSHRARKRTRRRHRPERQARRLDRPHAPPVDPANGHHRTSSGSRSSSVQPGPCTSPDQVRAGLESEVIRDFHGPDRAGENKAGASRRATGYGAARSRYRAGGGAPEGGQLRREIGQLKAQLESRHARKKANGRSGRAPTSDLGLRHGRHPDRGRA